MSADQLLVAADVYTMSAGRIAAFVAGAMGVVGVVFGVRAMRRNTGNRATVALALGIVGMIIGGVVVATSDSGIGTGNGRGGAYVALVVGLVSVVLGTLARRRTTVG